MRARSLLLCLALAPLLSGCVTAKVWERYSDARRAALPAPPPPPRVWPIEALRAVRAGDGSYHVIARYSDDTRRRLIVEPLEAAPVTSGAWPAPARDGPTWPRVVDDTTLPAGVPVRVASTDAAATPDPELAALVGDVPGVVGGPVLELTSSEVRLVPSVGAPRTLAHLPRTRTRRPPPTSTTSTTSTAIGCMALTPFALVVDLAIGAGFVAIYALPYVLPILLGGCS